MCHAATAECRGAQSEAEAGRGTAAELTSEQSRINERTSHAPRASRKRTRNGAIASNNYEQERLA